MEWLPHREYHCRMLLKEIKERKKNGYTRAAILIDDSEAEILTELLTSEINISKTVRV